MATIEELAKLAEQVQAMTPGDKLRLAAELIERGKLDIAERIASLVVDELRFIRLFQAARGPQKATR